MIFWEGAGILDWRTPPPVYFLGVKGIDTARRRVVCSRCVSLRDDCKEDSMENLADCIRVWMIDYKKNSVKQLFILLIKIMINYLIE